jgi:hypothetical protein
MLDGYCPSHSVLSDVPRGVMAVGRAGELKSFWDIRHQFSYRGPPKSNTSLDYSDLQDAPILAFSDQSQIAMFSRT